MPVDHVDVLIIGAGLSGVGAACQLRRRSPGRTFAILESRGALGGTWDLFRYPGIRSDSDMFTLGYSFRPWTRSNSIAGGEAIREYIRDTAREHGVDRYIRFGHHVERAEWSSELGRWTVRARRADTAETVVLTCDFLFGCTGYYRYDEGYTPRFAGMDRFAGRIVHPQQWPEDLDYAGKRVVVIGSGATAVTLVPAMATTAAHVTMVQRSPSYLLSLPTRDVVADRLRRLLPAKVAYPIVRWKNILLAMAGFQLSRRAPELVKSVLRRGVRAQLPDGYDVDTHFTPRYAPWDQRLCLTPDGDLFAALSSGRASMVTDTIDTFTEKGLLLASGDELEADVVVTATGLNLQVIGGMALWVDGVPVDLPETVAYKGLMLSGVPNFAMVMGYTNASWTLRADLVAEYVCRLVDHMRQHGYQICTPQAPDSNDRAPLIGLTSGYVRRGLARLPKQGRVAPWRLHQNYARDIAMLRHGPVDDRGVRFSRVCSPASRPGTSAA